ncbi:MAG: YciI-like protein [Terriglobia bacterium]
MYFALFYDTVPEYLERRQPYRTAHLAYAKRAHQAGQLVMAGAFANPADGALFVFRVENKSIAEEFAQNDPYVINGLIKAWRVRDWTVVIGGE